MGKAQFVLFESASGYGLFEVVEAEEIGALLTTVQKSVTDLSKFSKIVKLKAFQAFSSAANALENINNISEGICSDDLKHFLEQNLPKVKEGKKSKFKIGVLDHKIGQVIQEELNFTCNHNETVTEIIRGIRLHLPKYISGLDNGNAEKAQRGLSHSYSRAKVKFNVNKVDNMIIQAICLLDQLDKDLNTFSMRIREWYGWHFPELAKIVKDNYMYARVAQYIGSRSTLTADKLPGLTKLTLDDDLTNSIVEAAKSSMGMDITEVDLLNVNMFATRLVSLAEYRQSLYAYMQSKMDVVAPNLGALIGEVVAARLISHAGSLTNLAKCPASTVQILGAEKALFRALKTKGNTPKYGLIFHSSFIGRASAKNKGRISRYLANKCAMAARIDSFADFTTTKYGEKLREQVEERLNFYETGEAPRKNLDVMRSAAEELKIAGVGEAAAGATPAAKTPKTDKKAKKDKKSKKDKKKRDRSELEAEVEADTPMTPVAVQPSSTKKARKSEKKSKKDKKDKKAKKSKA